MSQSLSSGSLNDTLEAIGYGGAKVSRLERLRVIPIVAAGIAALLVWSWFGMLDEVAVGSGKVVPPMRSQIIQSLEGGILDGIFVKEGDIVEAHQKLAQLNRERFSASLGESQEKALALEASTARLEAEIAGREPQFSGAVRSRPDLVEREMSLFRSRRHTLDVSTADLEQALSLARKQLKLTEPLIAKGAASAIEVIRLQQQENELQTKLNALRNQFLTDANTDYNKNRADLDQTREVIKGRKDQLARTLLTSPVHGIVKNLVVTTIGGIIQPGGTLMEIVPLEKQLMIETQVNPRDIAFIRPGLPATVKITAYDPAIYGSFQGTVERISPDTLQDDVDKRQVYYRVDVRTKSSSLKTKDGKDHEIMPGMIATVEIKTGQKSVLDYLIKPLNKAREALRER